MATGWFNSSNRRSTSRATRSVLLLRSSRSSRCSNQKVADPSRGLISDTSISKAASLAQLIADYETGIITGRRKISELADLRSRWASGGGAAIKEEFAASYAKANGR